MNNDINLLSKPRITKPEQYRLLLQRLALVILIITVLAAVGVFTLRLTTSSTALKTEENTFLTSLAFAHSKVAKILFIKSRVKDIDKLLVSRTSYADTVADIKKNLPDQVRLDALIISKDKIEVTATAPRLSSLSDFIDKTIDVLKNRKSFKRVLINNIIADEKSGTYHASVQSEYL